MTLRIRLRRDADLLELNLISLVGSRYATAPELAHVCLRFGFQLVAHFGRGLAPAPGDES